MALVLKNHWHPTVDGRVVRHAPGDRLPANHPKRGWMLSHGIAVDEDDVPAVGTPEPTPADPDPSDDATEEKSKRPSKVAKLEAWQDYARSRGVDPKGMKKEELIARFI